MTGRTRAGAAVAASVAVSGLLAVGAAAVAARSAGRADSGTIYAATTHTSGGYAFAAGQGTDKLFGPIAITYRIKAIPAGTTGTLNLTIKPVIEYTATGSILGSATATLTLGPNGAEAISNGKFSLTHGVGALRGHTIKGTFTGTGNTTANMLVIHSKSTYK
jgi:hypothetical protein